MFFPFSSIYYTLGCSVSWCVFSFKNGCLGCVHEVGFHVDIAGVHQGRREGPALPPQLQDAPVVLEKRGPVAHAEVRDAKPLQ